MTDRTAAMSGSVSGALRMGDVFNRSFAVFSGEFLLKLGILVIVMFVGLFLVFLLIAIFAVITGLGSTAPRGGAGATANGPLFGGVGGLVGGLSVLLARASVIQLAFRKLCGRPATVGAVLSHAFTRLLPISGTIILTFLICWLATLLFVIPGVIVAMRMTVSMQACLIEGLGPIAAIRRSRDLTRGNRWTIFGIYLVFGAVAVIALLMVNSFTLGVLGPASAGFVIILTACIIQVYAMVLAAAIYHGLRVAKDGRQTDDIAAVFD